MAVTNFNYDNYDEDEIWEGLYEIANNHTDLTEEELGILRTAQDALLDAAGYKEYNKEQPIKIWYAENGVRELKCPRCDELITTGQTTKAYARSHSHCPNCAQAIDWGGISLL